MTTSDVPPPGADRTDGADEAGADPLELAARAILGYLDDLGACRELCLRYETSVGVVPGPHGLHLAGAAELTPEGDLAHVRAALAALSAAGRWRGGPAGENGDVTARGRTVIARHVLWEGEPLHVAISPEGLGLLQVDLLVPDRPELSRLPLRAASSALRCLEHLLPSNIARPVALSELTGAPQAGLAASLRRATPEDLPSRQCIWPSEEGQSPTPLPLTPPHDEP